MDLSSRLALPSTVVLRYVVPASNIYSCHSTDLSTRVVHDLGVLLDAWTFQLARDLCNMRNLIYFLPSSVRN